MEQPILLHARQERLFEESVKLGLNGAGAPLRHCFTHQLEWLRRVPGSSSRFVTYSTYGDLDLKTRRGRGQSFPGDLAHILGSAVGIRGRPGSRQMIGQRRPSPQNACWFWGCQYPHCRLGAPASTSRYKIRRPNASVTARSPRSFSHSLPFHQREICIRWHLTCKRRCPLLMG